MERLDLVPESPDNVVGDESAQAEMAVKRLQWSFGRPVVSVLDGLTAEERHDVEDEFRKMALEEEAWLRRF